MCLGNREGRAVSALRGASIRTAQECCLRVSPSGGLGEEGVYRWTFEHEIDNPLLWRRLG
jgi:hypothetical protein